MSMNIGPMLRALMGEAQPTDGKALELRIGQIVRGVLMEMLDNQEAMIHINGVQVKAKLDAEMQVGKSTLLQVQPSGSGGVITLKPLADTSDAFPEDGLRNVLKTFGLPDQKWSMELLRGLKRDGYAIGRDTAAFFNAATALKPAGIDAASWSSAADVAFRRGLTPTETTLSSLRQALFGQPLHEELEGLRTAVSSWLGGSTTLSPEAKALGGRLQALLSQGDALLVQGEAQLAGEDGANNALAAKAAAGEDGIERAPITKDAAANGSKAAAELGKTAAEAAIKGEFGAGRAVMGSGAGLAAGNAAAGNAAVAAQAAAAAEPQGQPSAARAAGASASPPTAQAAAAAEPGAAAANRGAAAAATTAGAADSLRAGGKQADAAQPSAPKAEAAWIGRFLQWLGVGHEHKLMHLAEARLPGDNAGLPAGGAPAPGADAPAQEARPAADTLKGALLALGAHDEAPPALREAAQSLANQVTGQQLLLSSERNTTAPFSHMTLFVPMKGQNGETTATVHVQTRRSRRGEWDVDNCHLLFDLRMRNLGDTVVDVQVVDRIVSLKLLSDFPGMSDLLEQARDELAASMSTSGFQLLSLTSLPLPQWKNGSAASSLNTINADKMLSAGDYATKPYKGVDYRA